MIPKWIKQAYKSLVRGDSSGYPQGQAGYNGKPTDFIRLSVYGLCANAPKGSHVLLIGSQGQESVKFGIENDFIRRLKGLKSGEVALYNTVTESFVFLKENGDVEVSGADVNVNASGNANVNASGDISATAGGKAEISASTEINLTAPTINLNGNVVTTGTMTATDYKAGGLPDYSVHVHDDPVSGQTSVPK